MRCFGSAQHDNRLMNCAKACITEYQVWHLRTTKHKQQTNNHHPYRLIWVKELGKCCCPFTECAIFEKNLSVLRKCFLLFWLLAIIAGNSNLRAQVLLPVPDSLRVINFRVTDYYSHEPIGLAHVMNITQKKGCISDLLGYFSIPFKLGDSLSITAIGYHTKHVLNWGQFNKDTLFYELTLTPKVYQIEEVKISRFSTYDRFLREFANLKLTKTRVTEQQEVIQLYFLKITKGLNLRNLPQPTMGLSFGKDWYQKQNEKVAEAIEKDRKKRIADRKFNAGIVSSLTGLTGNELQEFMEYLKFDENYILTSTDYEIRERILDRFKEFETIKKGKNNTKK